VDEFLIALGQFCGHFIKRDTSGIHNGQIIAEGLKKFHKADAVGHCDLGRHTKKYSGAFFMLFGADGKVRH